MHAKMDDWYLFIYLHRHLSFYFTANYLHAQGHTNPLLLYLSKVLDDDDDNNNFVPVNMIEVISRRKHHHFPLTLKIPDEICSRRFI